MFIEAKDDGGGGDNWITGAISRAKLQSNHHHQQTNIQLFYKPDALPVAQPTVSNHWREKNITFHGLAYTKLTWGLPTLSLTTNSSWLPWGRVAMPLISPLMPVPQWEMYISRIMFNTDEKTWQKYYPGLLRAMVTITWQKTCFWKFQLLVIRSNLEYTGRSHNHLLEPNTSTKLL